MSKLSVTETKLSDLADKIRSSHEQVVTSLQRAVDHARQAGQLLCEAKECVSHGQWQDWLEEHFADQISDRTARKYMQLSNDWDKVTMMAKRHSCAVLSMQQALEYIAEAKEEEKQKKQEPRKVARFVERNVPKPVPVVTDDHGEEEDDELPDKWAIEKMIDHVRGTLPIEIDEEGKLYAIEESSDAEDLVDVLNNVTKLEDKEDVELSERLGELHNEITNLRRRLWIAQCRLNEREFHSWDPYGVFGD